MDKWPILPPPDWQAFVNAIQHQSEVEEVRKSVRKNRPYGPDDWRTETANRLELDWTLRSRGRPKKTSGVFLRKT
jgi:putative transposase